MRCLIATLFALFLPLAAMAEDSRLEMMNSGFEAAGWSSVGRLEVVGKGFCTAALISEREVLTAAHCVYGADGALVPTGAMTFAAGYRNGLPVTSRAVRRVAPHPDFAPGAAEAAQSAGTDIALIELQAPIGASQMAPFALGPQPGRGGNVGVVSYAFDRAEAPSLQEVCGVLETYGPAMILSCDVDFGASGAPVFALSSGQPRIVGVVTAKAFVGENRVAISAAAEEALSLLRATLSAQREGHLNDTNQVTVISRGERNTDIGAKFVRP